MRWPKLLIMTMAIAISLGATSAPSSRSVRLAAHPVSFTGELSVLTYNVHGLPWPLTWQRSGDFLHMADHLMALRAEGRVPQVVVLQEAFTRDARQIGRNAGYRFVVDGPDATLVNAQRPSANDPLVSGARWMKGEGIGKALGSGLQILSDYPIVRTRRIAFPAFACAGYDCLANKGAVMVTIRLPGAGDVDVVTTHFNARGASGVGDDRADPAYSLQAACLGAFIRDNHDPRRPLIVAGDFNIGTSAVRRAALVDRSRGQWSNGGVMRAVYDEAAREGLPLSADARYSRRKAKDWQFFGSGRSVTMSLRRVDVPFGHDADGAMLSDHVGYAGVFSLTPTRTAS